MRFLRGSGRVPCNGHIVHGNLAIRYSQGFRSARANCDLRLLTWRPRHALLRKFPGADFAEFRIIFSVLPRRRAAVLSPRSLRTFALPILPVRPYFARRVLPLATN